MNKLLEGTPTDWLAKGYFPVARTWKEDRWAALDSLAKFKNRKEKRLVLVPNLIYYPVSETWGGRGTYLYTVEKLDRPFYVPLFEEEFRKAFEETLELTGNPYLAWNYAYDKAEYRLNVYDLDTDEEEAPGEELRWLRRIGSVLAWHMRRTTAPFKGKKGLYVLETRLVTADYTVGRNYDYAISVLAGSIEDDLIDRSYWEEDDDDPGIPDWGPYIAQEDEGAEYELLEDIKDWARDGWLDDLRDGVTPEEIEQIESLRLVWGWGMEFGKVNPDTYETILYEAVLEEA